MANSHPRKATEEAQCGASRKRLAPHLCVQFICPIQARVLVNRAVHAGEPIGSQVGEIGVAGTSFQRFMSAGAVARQLLYIRAYRGRRSESEGG
jgi:hypothetical protein